MTCNEGLACDRCSSPRRPPLAPPWQHHRSPCLARPTAIGGDGTEHPGPIRAGQPFRCGDHPQPWPQAAAIRGGDGQGLPSSDCDDPGNPNRPGLILQATDPAFLLLSFRMICRPGLMGLGRRSRSALAAVALPGAAHGFPDRLCWLASVGCGGCCGGCPSGLLGRGRWRNAADAGRGAPPPAGGTARICAAPSTGGCRRGPSAPGCGAAGDRGSPPPPDRRRRSLLRTSPPRPGPAPGGWS
jgi:hypothetical protein